MASSKDKSTGGKGKIKFRFIEFEMDGGDATLQDAIKEITRAVGRPQYVKQVAAIKQQGNGDLQNTLEVDADEQQPEEEISDADADDSDASSDRPSKIRQFKSPNVLDVDLKAEPPLREFLAKLQEDTVGIRHLAIAYWFKKHRATADVNPDHIYTGYKAMGWTGFPRDPGSVLRALKADGEMAKGTGKGAYTINHIGEERVEEALKPTNTG